MKIKIKSAYHVGKMKHVLTNDSGVDSSNSSSAAAQQQ